MDWVGVVVGGHDPLLDGLTVEGRELAAVAAGVLDEVGVRQVGSLGEAIGQGGGVLVLDAHCPLVSTDDVTRVRAAAGPSPAVGVRPVTDTVKRVRHTSGVDLLGETVDRETLVAVVAPLAVPGAGMLAGLEEIGDLPELVASLRRRTEVALVEVGAIGSPGPRRLRPRAAQRRLSRRSARATSSAKVTLTLVAGAGTAAIGRSVCRATQAAVSVPSKPSSAA